MCTCRIKAHRGSAASGEKGDWMSTRNPIARTASLSAIGAAVALGCTVSAAPAAGPKDLCTLKLSKQLAPLHAVGACVSATGTNAANHKILTYDAHWASSLAPGASIQVNVTLGESRTQFYKEGENNGTSGGTPVRYGSGSREEAGPVDAQLSVYAGGVGIWIRVARQVRGPMTRAIKANHALLSPMLALAKAVKGKV
jgi:hypothetical protein